MKRQTRIGVVLLSALAWSLAATGHAGAAGRSEVLRPPFETTGSMFTSSLRVPCRIMTPPAPQASDAASGRVEVHAGASVVACASHATARSVTWRLGAVPTPFVGVPGIVVLVVKQPVAHVHARGTPALAQAEVSLRLGDRRVVLSAISCDHGACTSTELRPLPGRSFSLITVWFTALPSDLDLILDESAWIAGGTGSVAADFSGTLAAAVIRPRPAA